MYHIWYLRRRNSYIFQKKGVRRTRTPFWLLRPKGALSE